MKRFVTATILLAATPLVAASIWVLLYFFSEAHPRGEIAKLEDFFWPIAAFITCVYWTIVWGPVVRWSKVRLLVTMATIIMAILVAILCMQKSAFYYYRPEEKRSIAATISMLVYLASTVFIWPNRRSDMLSQLENADDVPQLHNLYMCPACRTDLTNATELQCPECHATHTTDSLLAACCNAADVYAGAQNDTSTSEAQDAISEGELQ